MPENAPSRKLKMTKRRPSIKDRHKKSKNRLSAKN